MKFKKFTKATGIWKIRGKSYEAEKYIPVKWSYELHLNIIVGFS